jgi:hypothetical protein
MLIQQPRGQLQSELLKKDSQHNEKTKTTLPLKINRLLLGKLCFIPEYRTKLYPSDR